MCLVHVGSSASSSSAVSSSPCQRRRLGDQPRRLPGKALGHRQRDDHHGPRLHQRLRTGQAWTIQAEAKVNIHARIRSKSLAASWSRARPRSPRGRRQHEHPDWLPRDQLLPAEGTREPGSAAGLQAAHGFRRRQPLPRPGALAGVARHRSQGRRRTGPKLRRRAGARPEADRGLGRGAAIGLRGNRPAPRPQAQSVQGAAGRQETLESHQGERSL